MSAVDAEKKVEDEENKVEKGGELLFCGGTSWDIIGRRKGSVEGNLVSPTRLRPLVSVDIRFVASGCGKFPCCIHLLGFTSHSYFNMFFWPFSVNQFGFEPMVFVI